MSEHAPDPNAEYLQRHPDAEPDPDRANTAAYARKKIEDLIEIAKANGQPEIEASLEKAADQQEKTEVGEYDRMKNELNSLLTEFSQALIELISGTDIGDVYMKLEPPSSYQRSQSEEDEEALEKFMQKLDAQPGSEMFFKNSDYGEVSYLLVNLDDQFNEYDKKIFLPDSNGSRGEAVIYDTNFPQIKLIIQKIMEGIHVKTEIFAVKSEEAMKLEEKIHYALESSDASSSKPPSES